MRVFEGGAIRDTEDGKMDFEGYLSPLALEMYGRYMLKHQTLADGSKRGSDNWQGGMGLDTWIKSLWRHFFDLWAIHRGHKQIAREDIEAALCGIMFNVQGYAHEYIQGKSGPKILGAVPHVDPKPFGGCNIPGCGCEHVRLVPRNATEGL